MNKPEVGQTVYALNVGNAARNREPKLTPYIVRKVGRKYFYISPEGYDSDSSWSRTKMSIDNWSEVSEYSATISLFETVEEYEAKVKADSQIKIIGEFFDCSTYRIRSKLIGSKYLEELIEVLEKIEAE